MARLDDLREELEQLGREIEERGATESWCATACRLSLDLYAGSHRIRHCATCAPPAADQHLDATARG